MRGRVNAIRTFKGLVADLRVKTKINQKAEVQQWTSALFYVEGKTFTGQQ